MMMLLAVGALFANVPVLWAQAPDSKTKASVSSGRTSGAHNEWTWVSGAGENAIARKGTYGTLGVAAAGNQPGGRFGAVGWTDSAGDFWMFGGDGYDSRGVEDWLGDLWKYSAGQWTWMGGSKLSLQAGIYGTLGVAATGNVPGARIFALGWSAGGNFWLFGGNGYDSAGKFGVLNDLWKYSGGQWTWMGGSKLNGQGGTYGTQGTAAASNAPGARVSPVGCTDASGNLWLFGGMGFGSTALNDGYLTDLWKYSAGQWTWIGGPDLAEPIGRNESPVTAAAGNLPWPHVAVGAWEDPAGNFWLFGADTAGSDMWRYSAGQWTLVRAWPASAHRAMYGVQGRAAPGNVPGSRSGAVTWTDSAGNFWLFGGLGEDAVGPMGMGHLNDLWEYSAGQWTWVGGSKVEGEIGTRGTRGVAAAGNVPGARYDAVGWTDAQGNFWLFGGSGYNDATPHGFNDLWKYVP